MITRNQTNADADILKQVHLELNVDGDWQNRHKQEIHLYPNYDQWVRFKIPHMGFTLSVDDARNLHALLTEALKEVK
jgi:hypothetical protein